MKIQLATLTIALAAAGCTTDKQTTPPPSPVISVPTVTDTAVPDGDWKLVSLRVKNTFGSFGGTARIQYAGDSPAGANVFTVTVFKGSREVGTLQGGVTEVQPGQTKTVTMISADKYVKGPWRYSFQKDF